MSTTPNSTPTAGSAGSAGSPTSPPRRVTANGIDFAYLEAGPADGPLALCLHGFPDHAPSWSPLMADLAEAGFHAVAPWMRGYAPTGPAPDGNYQTGALSADALALADALAPDRDDAVLIGHDWGAASAYGAVAHRPERFRKLVSLAVPHTAAVAPHLFGNVRQIKRSWYMFFFQMPIADMAVQMNDFAFIDMLWSDWSPGYTPDPSAIRALKDTLGSPGVLAAALGYYRATFDASAHDPAFASLQNAGMGPTPVPTLYLHGADDGCMGAELVNADALKPFFPGGLEVEVVPGTGHFLQLERPDLVNPRILRFLTSS